MVDTDGNPLENGGTYFIRPVIITGNGGGVEFAATGNETCPLSVRQNPSPLSNGLPVEISSPIKFPFIKESFILDIRFPFVAPCAPSPSKWTAVKFGGKGLVVKLTGYDNTVAGGFKIKSVPNDIGGYILLFCPENSSCGYVAIEIYPTTNKRLGVTPYEETAFWIRFQRVYTSSA